MRELICDRDVSALAGLLDLALPAAFAVQPAFSGSATGEPVWQADAVDEDDEDDEEDEDDDEDDDEDGFDDEDEEDDDEDAPEELDGLTHDEGGQG